MQMRRTALAGLTLSALLAVPAVALARPDTGPESQACTDATALEVQAQAALGVALDAVLDLSPDLLDGLDDRADLLAGGVLDGLLGDPDAGEAQADIAAAIQAAVDLDVAIGDRGEVCADPDDGEPSPPGEEGDELDCVDFPLDDGRTPQQVLNADLADPNRLDLDGDGLACELDDDGADDGADDGEDDGADDGEDDGEDFSQIGGRDRVPSGGVATGA